MRLSLIVAAALVLTPLAISAQATSAPGPAAAASSDISAAKKKAKKPAKKKEDYLKAAPSAPPKGQSTY